MTESEWLAKTAKAEWQARVEAAWEPLARAFAAYPLDEAAIAPLRGLCRELDAALFAGFALYAHEREMERAIQNKSGVKVDLSGGSRSGPSAPINLEELDL